MARTKTNTYNSVHLPWRVAAMWNCHISDPQLIVHAQNGYTAVQWVTALEANKRCYLARVKRFQNICVKGENIKHVNLHLFIFLKTCMERAFLQSVTAFSINLWKISLQYSDLLHAVISLTENKFMWYIWPLACKHNVVFIARISLKWVALYNCSF